MPIKFDNLIEDVLFEALPLQSTTLKNYIISLLQNNTNYNLAIRDRQTDPNAKFSQLKGIAQGLNTGGGQYASKDELNDNRAFLPILDFLSVYVYPYFRGKPTQFAQALEKNIADFLKDIPQEQHAVFNTKLNQLSNPQNYQITDRNILKITSSQKRLSSLRYEGKTPLDGILAATKDVGGYKEREVTDIMKYPREYDVPGKITKKELEPIQNISEALYFFYIERIKHPTYISILRNMVPNLQNSSDEQIENIIDNSVGTKRPQNNAFQIDYELFLSGKSKYLVQLTEESSTFSAENLLNEIIRGISGSPNMQTGGGSIRPSSSGYVPKQATGFGVNKPVPPSTPKTGTQTRVQGRIPPQEWQVRPDRPKQQTNQPEQQKTIKPTTMPLVTSIKDFSRPGYNGDLRVQNAYSDFFNFLTKGTALSTGQKVLKGIEYFDRAAGAVGNWMTGFKPL